MKKFLSLMLMFTLALQVFAQSTNQITENYLVTGPWTDYVVPLKYSYTVSDEGERIMNGPISISGRQNETYGNVTITGSYVLNASAKNGYLNGSMSVKANYHGVKRLLRGQQVEDYAYSFSGNFLNGVPNGTFAAKATNFGSSNVSYKNGRLVGAYNVQEVIDDRILNIKGAFNDSGKMIGQWRIEILGDVSVWEFVNGIRIRESSESSESTPKQIEMAQKYATGAISEKELEAEGYFPVVDSIRLGDYASDLYFLKFMADWDKMPGRDFKTGFWVKYTYLYNILPIPKTKFEEILVEYKETGNTHYPLVQYDQLAKAYTIQYPTEHGVICRRFTDEQLHQIKEAVDTYCRNNPISLNNLFSDYDLSHKAINITQKYDEFKRLPNTQRYESLIKDYNDLTDALKKRLGNKELTSDGLYYIVSADEFKQSLSFCYLPVSSLNEFLSIEKDATELYCRKNPITISGLFKQQNVNNDIRDKALNIGYRFETLKKEEDIEQAYQKYESLLKDVDDVSKTLYEQLDGQEMTSDGKFYIIPSSLTNRPIPFYFEVSSLNSFVATEKEIKDYNVTLNRLIEEEVSKNLELALNGIEKQSKSKLTKLLTGIIVNKDPEYFAKVSHVNTVSIEEFAEAIAPVIEYKIVSVQREDIKNSDSYQVTMVFKKKHKKEEIVVPVSMSVTEKGSKIIDKTIALVSQ